MSDQFKAAPPRGGYVYQTLKYDEMAACNFVQGQNYFRTPDALTKHVLAQVALLDQGAARLQDIREFIDVTLDDLANQAVEDLTR